MPVECVYGRPSIMTVVYDGDPWREVHTSIFGRKPSLPQGCLSLEQFQEEFSALECQLAKRYALKRISVQAMLSTRLSRSLRDRLVSERAIEHVINDLTELGLLNDKEWTESYVRVQAARKMGPRAIAQKLAAKGMRNCKALEGIWDVDEQKNSIKHLLKTRYSKRNLKDARERQKVIASLARRGFDLSAILSFF